MVGAKGNSIVFKDVSNSDRTAAECGDLLEEHTVVEYYRDDLIPDVSFEIFGYTEEEARHISLASGSCSSSRPNPASVASPLPERLWKRNTPARRNAFGTAAFFIFSHGTSMKPLAGKMSVSGVCQRPKAVDNMMITSFRYYLL